MGVRVPSDGDAKELFETRGVADTENDAEADGVFEGQRDEDSLADGDGVGKGEAVEVRDPAEVVDNRREGEAVCERDPAAVAERETAGDLETELEPVTLRETGPEALTEPVGLPREDADALRTADGLPPAAVALQLTEVLPAPLEEAQAEARSLMELCGVTEGEADPRILPLASEEGEGILDMDALPQSDPVDGGEAVPRAAVPLPHGETLAVALSVAPPLVALVCADGVVAREALGAAEDEAAGLGEPARVPDDQAELVSVGHPLALPDSVPVVRALEVNSTVSVSGALEEAAAVGLSTGDGETTLLAEGGGERLPDGLCEDEGEALTLAELHRDTVGEAENDGLCDGLRVEEGEEDGRPDAEAQGVTVGVSRVLRLASGEREVEPLLLSRPLALGLPVSLREKSPVRLAEALRPTEGVPKAEREANGEGHAVAVAPREGVT